MRINAKATPTNDTNYSCHIKAIVLFNQPYEVHIMPLVIDSLRGRHTCIHIHMNARTHAHMHAHTHERTHARTRAHTHVPTHARTHTHTHTHDADKITTSARLV